MDGTSAITAAGCTGVRAKLTSAEETSKTLRAAAQGHEAAKSKLSASRAELETQLAVARADAERLRWVRLHSLGSDGSPSRKSLARTHP